MFEAVEYRVHSLLEAVPLGDERPPILDLFRLLFATHEPLGSMLALHLPHPDRKLVAKIDQSNSLPPRNFSVPNSLIGAVSQGIVPWSMPVDLTAGPMVHVSLSRK